MNLYIIRHAIAVDEGTPEYEQDSERPLTDKGKKKMRQISKGLRTLGADFDLILSSPYVRAKRLLRSLRMFSRSKLKSLSAIILSRWVILTC